MGIDDAFLIFQFHKGTIRTIGPLRFWWLVSDFNSIKVRLEQTKVLIALAAIANFNSIKVRLELLGPACEVAMNIFQFHKGTIRTKHSSSRSLATRISIP